MKTPAHFSHIAELISKKKKDYDRLVVVVSAMQGMTDHLIHLGRSVHPQPPQRELDMLISIGERTSIALLSMALHARGELAISFTGSQSGILTNSEHTQARIVDVRPTRLESYLSQGYTVIVAGFQGVSFEKEITTLGRGGSDTSAVALGVSLDAERVEFYKDVGGIYEKDPKIDPKAKLLEKLTYIEALRVAQLSPCCVLHPRCIELASKNELPLQVLPYEVGLCSGTLITSEFPQKGTGKIYESSL